jgi:hypothetical protein
MFEVIPTAMIGFWRSIGELLGYELDVVISEHKIKLEMVNPENLDSSGRAWDDSCFTTGNLHLEGIANPIKPELPDDDSDASFITSERYKTFMEQSLIDDIISEGSEHSGLTLLHVLVILSTVQFVSTLVIVWFLI